MDKLYIFLNNIVFLFKNLNIKDFLDIFFIFIFTFSIIYFLIQIIAWHFLLIIGAIFLIYYLSKVLNLVLSYSFLNYLFSFGILIILVIFQKEIRKFILSLRLPIFRYKDFFKEESINEIIESLDYFLKNNIGAILVFKRNNDLKEIISNGITLNTPVNSKILISIFQKSSPLHDGAVIIDKNKIKIASAILPLSSERINTSLGTRHLAALGVTEETDAFSIVVSEINNSISLAERGEIKIDVDIDFIKNKLIDYYSSEKQKIRIRDFLKVRLVFISIIIALIFSFSLWSINNYRKSKIQKIIEVPIEFKNLTEGYTLSNLNTEKIKITLSGYETFFKTLDPGKIKTTIDLANFEEGSHLIKIENSNLNINHQIEIIKIEPPVLEFKIIKISTSSEKNK